MRTTLRELLKAQGSSSTWQDATLDRIINLSQTWVAKTKFWSLLITTSADVTIKDKNYYDFPSNYLRGTIFFINVDSVDYSYVDIATFLKSDYGVENTFAILGSKYYIYETPTTADLVINIYHQKRTTTLTEDTDESILQEELHEGILQRALYLCLKRDKKTNAALEAKNDALEIINDEWAREKKVFRGSRTIGNVLDNFPNYSASGNV